MSEYPGGFPSVPSDLKDDGERGRQSDQGDRIQTRIADKVRATSESLFGRGETDRQAGLPATFETQARDFLKTSADYIEQADPKKIQEDVSAQIRRNPGASLLIAGAAGLILGAFLRRR